MPTLPTLVPQSDHQTGSWVDHTGSGGFLSEKIDEGIASANDADYIHAPADANQTSGWYQCVLTYPMPSNFARMLTAGVRLRYALSGAPPGTNKDSYGFEVRIMKDSMVLAAADSSGGWVTAVALSTALPTTFTDTAVINFPYINSAALKTDWDGCQFCIRQIYTKVGSADVHWINLSAVEVTGTYQSGYTLTAAQASFALNGQATELRSSRKLTADRGLFTLTGYNATLTREAAPVPGFWIETDQAGTFKVKKLIAPVSQYAIAAHALPGSYVLTAAGGSFTLSGQAVALTYSGSGPPIARKWIETDQVGTFKIKKVIAPVSQYAIVGSAIPPGAYTLTAGSGTFALTGQNANLSSGVALPAVYDTVTDTNGTLASAHTPERGGALSKPATYQNLGVVEIQNNKYVKDSAVNPTQAVIYYYANDIHRDVTVRGTFEVLSVVAANAGLVARLQTGSDDYYSIRHDSGTTWSIRKSAAGTGSQLGPSATETLSAGNTRRVEFTVVDIGGVAYLRLRVFSGATMTVEIEATDATPHPAGKVGFRFSGSNTETAGYAIDDINAAKAYAMLATTGTFSLTGQNVTLTRTSARTLAASTGTFTLTGQAANLLRGYRLIATTGTFALSGTAANLLRGYRVTATTGTFTLSGTAANLLRGYRVTATTATFTLSGQNVNLVKSAARTMVASSGGFTLAGQATNLLRTRRLTAATGIYTVNGQGTGLLRGWRALANVGAFTINGINTGFIEAKTFSAATGSFNLTGNATNFSRSRRLTATAAIYTVNGNAATLIRQRRLDAALASFALTGNATALRRTRRLAVSVGSFTLTGWAATLVYEQITESPILVLDGETTLHTVNDGFTTLHEPGDEFITLHEPNSGSG
jgi:hypothetical protein